VLFLRKAELGLFSLFRNSDRLACQKIAVQPGWYLLPPQNIQLGENRFLQTRKGAENTKEKSRAVLYASLRNKGLKT
jgi:hypothetical protein